MNVSGQNRMNVWELSYSTDTVYPNSEIQFDSMIADTNSILRPMAFSITNSSICDKEGNLLFPVFLTGSPEFTDQIILSAGAAHLYRCKVLSAWYLTDWFVW